MFMKWSMPLLVNYVLPLILLFLFSSELLSTEDISSDDFFRIGLILGILGTPCLV